MVIQIPLQGFTHSVTAILLCVCTDTENGNEALIYSALLGPLTPFYIKKLGLELCITLPRSKYL
jgi:hypothetical protein